ncbi:type II toxin-antitoxin system VapC family toxin [Sphingomonas sp. SRS2]|jgi:predicted nucleic-acid-binding protein|uniref:type II toxin-antitoxin system VapC family toxin n=1 Tax=Sphingomonas sp. SRS2 TaxID=133190 RepID=UPI000618468D|nr:type II toxin-antitoxin system VapC family toxin [Sphingomonas sp. SRS2]KKC24043.1 DNA-binding protein [Sphingomonas sp. SRS2]
MKITADTNVLLRLVLADDEAQGLAAVEAMESASLVAISVHSLCELAWVLERLYKKARPEIAAAIRGVIEAENVVVNRPAVDAGLAVLDAGGDFADGVIAFDGQWLGGETFVSFDKTAVKLLDGQGIAAQLLK